MRHSPAASPHLPSAPSGWFALAVPETLVALVGAAVVASWADDWWAGFAVVTGVLLLTGAMAARRGSTQVVALVSGSVTTIVGFYAVIFLIARFLLAHYQF